ncbi:MAG: hypothetical protein NTX25_08680 [Proteobacteria bacterium]|nr:hypothetical protein [Pseudomonadota bacterium]
MNIELHEAGLILSKIQQWSSKLSLECMEFRGQLDQQGLLSHPSLRRSRSEPLVYLDGAGLWVDHMLISLASRERTLKLVETFFKSETLSIKKSTLLALVYEESPENVSDRLGHALEVRLTKLMSRTRKYLADALCSSPWKDQLEWLVPNQSTQSYQLYKIHKHDSFGEHAIIPKPEA